MVKISGLHCYPVKSLAGISLSEATALESGIQHDRQWGVFQEDGHPLTQRKNARMTLIKPTFDGDALILSASGYGEIPVNQPINDSPIEEFTVWKDPCVGQRINGDVNAWLEEVLQSKKPLSMAKVVSDRPRQFIKPERFKTATNYFSDAAPYLIATQQSLDALNASLAEETLEQVDIRHFRPNIVIDGIEAFTEHTIKELASSDGAISFRMIDHCQRCVMITINPDTGQHLPKATPFKTLTRLNSMPDNPKAPAFGVNATLKSEHPCYLSLGQELKTVMSA